MTSAKIEQLRLDVEELTKLSEVATRQRVKDILILDMRKLETEISTLREKLAKEEAEAKKEASSASIVSSTTKCYNVKISNYCWDQTPKFVKVFVSLPGVETLPKENITCDFTSRSMELHINGLDNKNYYLPILNLCKNINPDQSDFKIKSGNVIVNLAKAVTSDQWPDVVSTEKSSKMKPPNFEPSDDPSQSLITMLKQMYDEGDDEMKRTLAKAWVTNQSNTLG